MKRYLYAGLVLVLLIGLFTFSVFSQETFAPYEDGAGVRQYCACGNRFVSDAQGTVQYVGDCLNHKDTDGNIVDGCDGTILSWSPWTSASSLPTETSGNYYLTTTVDLTGQNSIAANKSIALDLNGQQVYGAQNTRAYSVHNIGASLILTDTAGGGTIYARGTNETDDALGLWVRYGSFTMYGGTIDASGMTGNAAVAMRISTTESNDVGVWDVTVLDEEGNATLMTPGGQYLTRTKSSSNLSIGNTETSWTLEKDVDGYYTVTNQNGDSRYLSYNGTGFKAYAAASSSRFIQFKMIPTVRKEQEMKNGNYAVVAVANGKYYAMGNTVSSGVATATEVTVENGILTTADVVSWQLTLLDEEGNVTLTTPEGKYLGRTASSSNLGLKETQTSWQVAKDEAGYYTLINENGDSRYLSYNGTGFKAYAAASSSRFVQFLLIPIDEVMEAGSYYMVAVAGDQYFAVGNTAKSGVVAAKEVTLDSGIPTAVDAMTGYSRFSLFGGTVVGGQAAQNGGSIVIDSGSVMNMYGGTVRDGIAGSTGGNIHNDGTLNLYGGTVSGGTAATGGNICNTGTLQISEACVENVESVYTRQELEDALTAAAWAYYLKEDQLQYCSQEITSGLTKYTGGSYRLTEDAAPEYGTGDTTIYSVCSDFVYKVYYEALGHRLFGAENYLGATTSDFWLKSEDVALLRWINASYEMDSMDEQYGVTRDKELTTEEACLFMENWEENLRPGDVIVFTGHAFLYVGNGYVMDCWGEKYNEATGLDAVEGSGGVHYLHTVEGLFLTGTDPITQSYVIQENSSKDWLVVFRPLDAFVKQANAQDPGADRMDMAALSEKAGKLAVSHSREANPAMEIDRTVNISPYGTAVTGEALTYSVAISNKSNDPDYLTYRQYTEPAYAGESYQGLVVTERIPDGTRLVEGSINLGGTYRNGVITWVVNIPAGETVALSYQVQVKASVGSTVVSGGGYVGGIPSNTITNTVGGEKLSADALAALTALAETPTAQWRDTYNISKLGTDLTFADRVYQAAMGIGLDLPTIEQILNNLFTFQTVTNASSSDRFPEAASANLFVANDTVAQEYQLVADMMVAGYCGGQRFYSPVRGLTINEFSFDYLEPGDVLVCADVKASGQITGTEVYVYCGNGTLVVLNSQKEAAVLRASSYNNADLAYAKLWNALAKSIFFVLRPSQAYENINDLTYDASNEPIYGKEPAEPVSQLGSNTLSEENLAALEALTVDGWTTENTYFAEEVYGRIGIDITSITRGLTVADILKTELFFDADYVQTRPYHYDLLATPAESNEQLAAMLVRELRGGPDMLGYEENRIRISDLQSGDILNLVNREKSRYWICVYQGNGKLLTCEGGTRTYQIYDFSNDADGTAFADFITNAANGGYAWECYYVLRPSNGFVDINTVTYALDTVETADAHVVLKQAKKTAKAVSAVQTADNNEEQVYGTFITGGTASNGGNIYSTGTVYISGGSISGSSNLFTNGSLEISGNAQITGGLQLDAGCQATLKDAPVIDSIYIDNTGSTLPDVSGLVCSEPISVATAQQGAFAASAWDNSHCFASAQQEYSVVYDSDADQLQIMRNLVYVSDSGSDSAAGTLAEPYQTLDKALSTVIQGGTVHIVDTLTVSTWNAHGKSVTITGGQLDLAPASNMFFIRDAVAFQDMTLWMPDPASDGNDSSDYFYVFCCGNKTCISENVTVKHGAEDGSYDGINTRIFGGSNVAVDSTDLTVLAGRWGWIYGGSYKANISGDVHLTVGGNVNQNVDYLSHSYSDNYLVIGGSSMGDIAGTVYMNITGGNGYTTAYGGSNGTCSIGAVELTVTGGEGMAVYGGGLNGVNTIGTVDLYYEGGSFEQVFGGCLYQNLVGDVNVWLTGGNISRRVYGGSYNATSGLSSFSSDHLVEGYVNLYIGSGINITLDYNDNDLSIYAHSRHKAGNSDAEHSRIIFLDQAAYTAYGRKLGAQDTVMKTLFMRGITAADYICYMGTSANDETNVITVGAVEVQDNANDALDMPAQTATLVIEDQTHIYEGTALTPASVVYSDNWISGVAALSYADNDAVGTATVTATVNGCSVSKTFQIRQYVCSVTANGVTTRYLTVQEAVDNASGGYVQLLADVQEQVTASGDLYLDVNGHDLSGITVSGTLYGMDSTTDSYSDANLGKLAAANNVADQWTAENGNCYISVCHEDGSYSFHRIYVGITKLSLQPGVTGFGYKAEFYADATVQPLLEGCGYDLWLTEDRVVSCSTDSFKNVLTLRLKNFDIENFGSAKVNARAFMKLNNGTVIESSIAAYSMQDMVELIDANLTGYETWQIQAVKTMLEGLSAPDGWDIPNLLGWEEA